MSCATNASLTHREPELLGQTVARRQRRHRARDHRLPGDDNLRVGMGRQKAGAETGVKGSRRSIVPPSVYLADVCDLSQRAPATFIVATGRRPIRDQPLSGSTVHLEHLWLNR